MNYLIYAFDYPKNHFAEFIFRYEKVLKLIENEKISSQYKIIKPRKIKFSDCSILHDKNYLKKLKEKMAEDEKIAENIICDLLGVSGTICACELALKNNIAYHLGGGFHHAFKEREGAFDYLNDIAIAIQWLRKKHSLKRIAIIDLDVHHADGTQKIFYSDPEVLQISFHGYGIFPGTGDVTEIGDGKGKGYKINLPLCAGTSDKTYLWAMDKIIPKYIEAYQPELVIYQAGVDCMLKDKTGNLKLSLDGVYKRDEKIKEITKDYPLAIIRGGGYNNEYSPKANVNTLACFANLPIIYSYKKSVSEPKKCKKWAERKIKELEEVLSKYW